MNRRPSMIFVDDFSDVGIVDELETPASILSDDRNDHYVTDSSVDGFIDETPALPLR